MYHRSRFFFIPVVITALLALFSWITMLLWNALLPGIFHIAAINFWQAAGLLLLARLFFGGFHPKWNHDWPGHKMDHELRSKIRKMSPEERKEFFRKMHHSRGSWYREHPEENTQDATTKGE